jgi:sugar O-acyltransferase (sialic acid O-acetyltransferase NeuD family)
MDERLPASEALVLYGCGTQGQAILEFVLETSVPGSVRVTDDNPALWGQQVLSAVVQKPQDAFAGGPHRFVCTIGDNRIRQDISERLRRQGHLPHTACHPSALVAGSSHIDDGSVLMPRVVVNSLARVGEGCLLNTACVVEHHCQIGSYVHLAPGVLLGGGVSIGDGAMLGLGAVVLPGLRIGVGAVVGAGTVVIRDVPPGVVVVGNPARPLVRATLSPSPPPSLSLS